MPNWNSVLKEIADERNRDESAHDRIRRKYLDLLFRHTERNVIAYYSGFLTKRIEGVEINDEDKNGFMLCIHELDRNKGLDLILHTPGGDGHATESLVDYLRAMFGKDIRCIVPQIAMSAGTMIACSCKEIMMGKQSSLGPIDPQFGSIAAVGLLEEVKIAYNQIIQNPNASFFWSHILNKIPPGFLQRCEWAVKNSKEFIAKTLVENMLFAFPDTEKTSRLEKIRKMLSNDEGKAHNTHFQIEECLTAGLVITSLEDDQKLQDLVLTIHHCYMHTLANTQSFKIVENHLGRAIVKIQQNVMIQPNAPVN